MTDLRKDFRDLDRAHDPEAGLRYLDAVGSHADTREYKSQTFEMLELASGHTVLDVGCGTGDDARALAARVGPGGRVVGVDISEAAVAEATKRSAGSSAPVEFRRGDALSLDFPADQFDGVRADRVFIHLEDPTRALLELVRVTRPGGKIVVFEPDFDTLVIDSPDRVTTRAIVQCNADGGARNGWMGRQLRALFLNAGLGQVDVRAHVLILTSMELAAKLLPVSMLAEKAVDADRITATQAAEWLDHLRDGDRAGRFFVSLNGYMVAGRKPETD